mmetsp:Transcript_1119/g.2384  ORF Transcript_1119/g.2384 Transcript_1119/m.2384 type:complete len:379 (-) Transcript_1119:1986-3122(-)
MEAAWENVSPELKPLAGSRSFPSVRYSACAVAYAGQLVVTHGYFYNHAIHHPAWQSDAWTFDTATKNWQKVHEGERAGAPSARYSTSCVVWDDALWMYGGDDGGHKRSMFNYVFGAHFSEMWRMDLRTFQWRKVNYAAGAVPPKRALHAACVIGSAMYVYGGLELSDTWRFDFPTRKWQLLAAPLDAKDPNHPNAIEHPAHPGRRHALKAVAGDNCFYVFGGGRHGQGHKPRAFNDLHRFSLDSNTWSRIKPVDDAIPPPRTHYSLVALSTRTLLLYGGARCTPGCTCYGDVWIFDVGRSKWSVINATSPPIHRYRQNLVYNEQDRALYLFGGESYQPYMYHNAVDKLTLSGDKLLSMLDPPVPPKAPRKKRGWLFGH